MVAVAVAVAVTVAVVVALVVAVAVAVVVAVVVAVTVAVAVAVGAGPRHALPVKLISYGVVRGDSVTVCVTVARPSADASMVYWPAGKLSSGPMEYEPSLSVTSR